jgi:hypothetical protein
MGFLLALGAAQTEAATTNYWVQNVSLTLKAYVQGNNQILEGTLPTKQFLAFLSGIPNPALVASSTVVPATNYLYTNLTVEATNFWLLPITAAPPGDLPRSYTVTTDYVLTPDGGLTFYTNNINFTNDVVVNRTSDTNVTYTFYNYVSISSTQNTYLFPELAASSITAVWTNQGPGAVFVLSGSVSTNVVGTTTNYTYANNPDFSKQPGAKLLYITPMLGGTNLPSRYVVRYKQGKNNVDTDVSAFLYEYSGSPYLAVYEFIRLGNQTHLNAFTEIDFNNRAGTRLNLLGFDTESWAALTSKGTVFSTSVLKQRKMEASDYSGYISGTIQSRTFTNSTTVVNGTISITGGKIE